MADNTTVTTSTTSVVNTLNTPLLKASDGTPYVTVGTLVAIILGAFALYWMMPKNVKTMISKSL